MIDLKVEFNKSKYNDVLKKVSLLANEAEVNKAINRAAKRAADTAKAETVRQLTAEYTLPASEIRRTIASRNIGGGEVGAVMKISDGAHALFDFQINPKTIPTKKPVTVSIKKGQSGVSRHGFVAKMNSGHIGLFSREGEERLPVIERFGPSTTGMFKANNAINESVVMVAGETFEKRVLHELDRLMYG